MYSKLEEPAWRFLNKLEAITNNGFRDLPTNIDIEINSKCTRRCYYCPRPIDESEILSADIFYSIIDQLRVCGYKGKISPISFNEPLTDDRLNTFLEYVIRQLPDSEIVLNTNGDLLTREKVEEFYKIGVSSIVVSLHDPLSAEQERRLREFEQEFDKVKLVDRRDGYRKHPLFSRGGKVVFENSISTTSCIYTTNMVIRATGDVTLCCEDIGAEYKFGNVYDQGVREIWQSPRFRQTRKEIQRGSFGLPICDVCCYEDLSS